MAGGNCVVLSNFWVGFDSGGNSGQNSPLAGKRSRAQRPGSIYGRPVRFTAGFPDGGNCAAWHDGVCTKLALAAGFGIGAIFSGGGTRRNLGRAIRVAVPVLSGTGLFETRASTQDPRRAVGKRFCSLAV